MARRSRTPSRAQVRARYRKVRPRRRGVGMWYGVVAVLVVLGVVLVVVSRNPSKSAAEAPQIGDHWHAAIGVNVCGTWLADPPAFESQNGIHSHGDGLIHIHPFVAEATGKNANVGRFFTDGGWSLSATSMTLWDGKTYKNGDKCGDKPARIVWKAANLEDWKADTVHDRTGDPAKYAPKNADIVAIGFLPEGQDVTEPPTARVALAGVFGPDTVFGTDSTTSTSTPAPEASSSVPATTTTKP